MGYGIGLCVSAERSNVGGRGVVEGDVGGAVGGFNDVAGEGFGLIGWRELSSARWLMQAILRV